MFVSMAAVTTLGQTGEGEKAGREGRYHAQCQKCGCEPCHAIHTLWLNLWYRMAGRGQIEHHITSSEKGVSPFHRLPSPEACVPLALPLIALLHLDTPPSFPAPPTYPSPIIRCPWEFSMFLIRGGRGGGRGDRAKFGKFQIFASVNFPSLGF